MENSTKVRNVKSLLRDLNKGTYNLNHIVQRSASQWSKKQQELLLDSIINKNIVIPQIVFAKQGDDTFVIDGKQRLTVLDDFVNNEESKLKFEGKKFSELDSDIKDKIQSAEITTITYTDCTDADIFELFERYNNGVSLSGSQKTRSYATMPILAKLEELKENPFMEKCNITAGQKKKGEDDMVLLQASILISGYNFKDFSFKTIENYLKEVEESEILTYLDEVNNNMNILNNFVDEKQKNLKKINLPMILATAVDTAEYKDKLNDFLLNYKDKEEYRSHCVGSTSQKEHVLGRLNYWK